jgi:RNA polymerase sigma factor (sigma-70 family)
MGAVSLGARGYSFGLLGSRRLLAAASDRRLVDQVRRGNDAGFEIIFERYAAALLSYCRHMLASPEEAEDAVQLTFMSAHRDLMRDPEREISLRPWLFTIARNRCLSILRARRERPTELSELPTTGLAEHVEERAELRQLLADVGDLPEEQRSALLLAEVGDLSHAQVADVLGCPVSRVKALVFRARSALIDRRAAREIPCTEIQEQLANLRGGALRRTPLQLHLRGCEACRAYRDGVRHQRRMLAAALPVAPTVGLKASVLTAAGIGGGSATGAAAGLSSIGGAVGGGGLAKLFVLGALAGGGAIGGYAAVDSHWNARHSSRSAAHPSRDAEPTLRSAAGHRGEQPGPTPYAHGNRGSRGASATPEPAERASRRASSAQGGRTSPTSSRETRKKPVPPGQAKKSGAAPLPPGQAKKSGERGIPPGQAKKTEKERMTPGSGRRTGSDGVGNASGKRTVAPGPPASKGGTDAGKEQKPPATSKPAPAPQGPKPDGTGKPE